jgi:hypothetical protein
MNLYMRWGKSGDGKRKEGGFTLKEGEVGRKRAFLVCVCMESGGGGGGFQPFFFAPSQSNFVFSQVKSSRMSPRDLCGASVRFV